VITGLFCAVVA